MRTGILGGTFDPIHIAHLHTAETALHQLELDRVLVMPAGAPWQKSSRDVTPGEHRLEMCRLAVEGVERLEVDGREVTRTGPTYTIDTLESFPDDEDLTLILGSDSVAGLDSWHRHLEILERAQLAVAARPGVPLDALAGLRFKALSMGLLEVSGTEIRKRAAAGEPYRFLVTEPVYRYIEDHGLYANDSGADSVGASMETEERS